MMGNYFGRMYWGGGFDLAGLFIFLFWIFAFIDVVLLAVWLMKQLREK